LNEKTRLIFEKEHNSDEDYMWLWDVAYKEKRTYDFINWKRLPSEINSPVVLNLSCGYGLITDVLYEKYGNKYTIVCTELVKGKVHDDKPYSVYELDLDDVREYNDRADVVICSHVLQYLKDPYKSLNMILNLTDKYLILVVPFTRKPPESGMHHAFKYSKLKSFIESKGFKIKSKTYESDFFSGIFKKSLAAHAILREKLFKVKYRRRVYADTFFRKVWFLFGLYLTSLELDRYFGFFQRSGVMILCERK
jgi:SAM-dependent methyltransferase